MRRALALIALAALAGCGSGTREPAPFGSASAGQVVQDGMLLTAVKGRLTVADPDTIGSVGVAVRHGVVTLRGDVRSKSDRAKLVADARGVSGVTEVVDDLTVNPNAPRPKEALANFALAARIDAAIAAQLGTTTVHASVSNGVATLAGTVKDAAARSTALATARGTSGIRNVVDRIRVQPS